MALQQKLHINHVYTDYRKKRLAEIGISKEKLELVIRQGVAQANNSTNNDRNNDAGNRFSSAVFRELANISGWIKTKKDHIEFIYNPKTCIAIIPYAGNQDTGIVNGFSETKHKRGKETKLPVNSTAAQNDLFPTEDSDFVYLNTNDVVVNEILVLLYHWDKINKEIRYELSRPKSKNKFPKGYINDWHERLNFAPISLNDAVKIPPIDSQENDSPELDIPIEFLEK